MHASIENGFAVATIFSAVQKYSTLTYCLKGGGQVQGHIDFIEASTIRYLMVQYSRSRCLDKHRAVCVLLRFIVWLTGSFLMVNRTSVDR